MNDDAHNRLATAYHEAGHAVIGYILQCYLGTVTIVPNYDEWTAGSAEVEVASGLEEDTAVMLYAGLAAQRLVHPESGPDEGARDDYERAAILVPMDRHTDLQQRAAELVAEHRGRIDDLAAALLVDETLKPDEVVLVIECRDDGATWRDELAKFRAFRNGS